MRTKVCLVAALLGLSACASIESKNYIAQPVGRSIQTGIGGVVVHVDRKRNLENLFGRADIYGRKTYEGYSELRFMGLYDGQAALRRIDVAVQNDETTMNRGGFASSSSTSHTSGSFGRTPFRATTNTYGPTVYIPPTPSNVSVSDPNVVDFTVPLGHSFPFEGYTITIAAADNVSATYSIQKVE